VLVVLRYPHWQSRDSDVGNPGIANVGDARYGHHSSPIFALVDEDSLLHLRDFCACLERDTGVNRDLELRIKGHLYEIGELNDEVLGSRPGYPASEAGYSKTLESVAECADRELVDAVAGHIKDELRANKQRPENRSVRREARRLLVEDGVVPDDYLNTA